jgi:hypothetical protein
MYGCAGSLLRTPLQCKFPDNREKNRKFRDFAGQSAFSRHIIQPVQWFARKFPRIRNREIIQPNREFERPDQGFEMSKSARVFRHPAPRGNVTAVSLCVIKGNISSKGERIYHVPGGLYYNVTVIDTSKGERWFCTEAEAVAAGWRKSTSPRHRQLGDRARRHRRSSPGASLGRRLVLRVCASSEPFYTHVPTHVLKLDYGRRRQTVKDDIKTKCLYGRLFCEAFEMTANDQKH